MEHPTNNCDENLIHRLDDNEYIKKIESEVNNCYNLYVICYDTDLKWLITNACFLKAI